MSDRVKPRAPFLCIDRNYVINLNHVVWFRKHSDQSLTVGLSAKGPHGNEQVQISDKAAIAAFMAWMSNAAK